MTLTAIPGSIESKLAVLDMEELTISGRRTDLHIRIDGLYLSTPLDEWQVTELDLLEDEELAISAQRRKLHDEIDGLRAQIGLPRSRDAQYVGAAA